MWPFQKKPPRIDESRMLVGFTDWHSHLLPGVDDGIQTLEESLQVLEKYAELGVKRVWLTPHIMEECCNSTEHLRERFEFLKSEYKGGIELRLAAENMIDSLFEERIRAKDLLPIGEEQNHLLVETSYVNPPMGMDYMMQDVMSLGLTPILAHPERYRYMEAEDYEKWKKRGVLFQCNIMSILGYYGETARHKVHWLLKEGMIDMTGSDLHRYRQLTGQMLKGQGKDRKAMDALIKIAENPNII